MKVLYNKIDAIVGFERADGSQVRLQPRNSAADHAMIEDHEADLPGIIGLHQKRYVVLMTLEQSHEFEKQRSPKAPKAKPAAPEKVPDEPETVPVEPEKVPDEPETVPVEPEEIPDEPEKEPERSEKSTRGRKKKKNR